jgi:hypothetical protein
MKIYEIAKKISQQFETRYRPDRGDFLVLEQCYRVTIDLIREVFHNGGRALPSDERYSVALETLELLAFSEVEDAEEVFDVEPAVDIYTSDLLEWAKDHTHRVDEVLSEYGPTSIEEAVRLSQYLWKQELAHRAACFLQKYLDVRDSEEELLDFHDIVLDRLRDTSV